MTFADYDSARTGSQRVSFYRTIHQGGLFRRAAVAEHALS